MFTSILTFLTSLFTVPFTFEFFQILWFSFIPLGVILLVKKVVF